MSRVLVFTYGAASYLVFLATFVYAIGFIGNFGVPKSMDSPREGAFAAALAIDLALLGLFAVQHSVMARAWFKRMVTRAMPEAMERSTYVLASSAALLLLFWQWRPLGGAVWEMTNETARVAMYSGFASGWLLVLMTTFVINHFDLFGLRQVWRHLRGQPQSRLAFVTPLLYRMVRHPLYVGWLLVFWCAPTMTMTHLVFAMMTTLYILVAIQFEERDLMREHPEYAVYRRQVPMLTPTWPREIRGAAEVRKNEGYEEARA
jgi:methanethiol S-methyltransferase